MMKRLCLSMLLSAPLAVWGADATPDSSQSGRGKHDGLVAAGGSWTAAARSAAAHRWCQPRARFESPRDGDPAQHDFLTELPNRMLLLSEVAHAEDAALSADKILAALHTPHRIEHHDLHVTVSVGVGVYPDDGTDAETLLKNADTALFNAKAQGRSNHQFFQPDMSVRASKHAC